MHGKSTPADIAISARNVTLRLGAKSGMTEILRGVSLDIPGGQSLAILGPSGSGKSSLMAILSGLERASGGEVRVGGMDYGALDEDALARARRGRIGIVLQSFHLLPTMTALENVAVPLELASDGEAFARAEEELRAVGLGERLTHYPAQLSGGEQQRVAIARAVAPRPEIIFADEPTGNLDGKTGGQIIDLLFERQRANAATFVLITHDAMLAGRCERTVEMRDGRIVADNPAAKAEG
ncbi:MAG TPA: ATP-binding cassette domain-containing protein [Allosphingosinicella sp.]|nr:ATP-binding cassette domain-containing protein [Allosphingosinicella sp.]